MKKFLVFILLFGLVSSVYSQMPQIEGMPTLLTLETYEGTVKYDFESKMYEKGKEKEPTLASKTTVWRKGNLERKESESSFMPGKKAIVFTLKDGIYNYMPEQKMAMKQPLPKIEPKPEEKAKKEEAKLPEPKKVGEEKYDDKLCEVYNLEISGKDEETGGEFKGELKYWLWKDKKIVVKLITTAEGKDEKGKPITITIETIYKNIDFKDLPDTVFTLPKETKIMDMTQPMVPGMPVPGMMPMPPAETPKEKVAEPEEKPKEEKPKKKGFGLPKLP